MYHDIEVTMSKPENKATMATVIRIRPEVWQALRRLAEARSLEQGGRPNASAVVSALIEREAKRRPEVAREH